MALVVVADDLIVKNPHYAYCMTLEAGSWEWWLRQCWVYDPVSAAAFVAIAAGLAKLLTWLNGAR